jgi:ferredoxin
VGAGLMGGLFVGVCPAESLGSAIFLPLRVPAWGPARGARAPRPVGHREDRGASAASARFCDVDCEGACNPMGPIRVSECLMCMNCLDTCPSAVPSAYVERPSQGGEVTGHGVTRRGFVAACLGRTVGRSPRAPRRHPQGVGARVDPAAGRRCRGGVSRAMHQVLRMRSRLPHERPAAGDLEHGWEALWTPAPNNRIGSSGCQLNCIACGQACPTGAIRAADARPKAGAARPSSAGPVRIGLASVDRGRCLPWAMERPCIVCQENCPVTPKAIYVSEIERTVRDGVFEIAAADGATLRGPRSSHGIRSVRHGRLRVQAPGRGSRDGRSSPTLRTRSRSTFPRQGCSPIRRPERRHRGADSPPATRRRSQHCIGCGVCEHECPMNGLRAIRVTADNESRDPRHSVLLASPA